MFTLEELQDPLWYIPNNFVVLTKADINGISSLTPMHLFPVQEHYARNRTHRDIIVKPRQVGISTGILALNFHKLLTIPYMRMIVVAHRSDTAEFLLQTVHRFYNHLPVELQPEMDWKSATRMRFPKLDALVHIDSAESRTIGRAESLNLVHLSEVSSWMESRVAELYAGITQTTSEGGHITIESTPRGRGGFFYRLYEAAKRGDIHYKPFFYPWWFNPGYKQEVPVLELTTEERLLADSYQLLPSQIAWRRLKITELGDLFFQEYPENDTDCWLSSGFSAFDAVALRQYLRSVKAGKVDGNLTTWKTPYGGRKYVIGADVGGGLPTGDFSVATVVDIKACECVAVLRGRIAPDMFAEELTRLGKHYNWATIAVERANHGHTILRILMEHNYPFIYSHRDYDAIPGHLTSQPGWLTSGKTRPVMIDHMDAMLRSNSYTTYSENFLREASCFQYVGQKAQAISGEFDDELFSAMIALMIIEQGQVADTFPRARPFVYATL